MADLAAECLANGLKIEEIPEELRTEQICINALYWGLKIYQTNDYKIQRAMCFRIMDSFPKDVLLSGFVRGHVTFFS
jgi:hypothetical protein